MWRRHTSCGGDTPRSGEACPVQPQDILSSSVNFYSIGSTFCEYSISHRTSIQPLSTFWASRNFCQLYVHSQDLPSTCCAVVVPSANIPCESWTIHQLSVRPRDLPSISMNFSCIHRTISQLPSTFRASEGLPVNFRQIAVYLWDPLTTSVNFPCVHGSFHEFPTAFRASAGLSVNFRHLLRVTRHIVNLRQSSVHPRDLLSTFCASARPSIYFCQLSVCLWGLPLASVNFPCIRCIFLHIYVSFSCVHRLFL